MTRVYLLPVPIEEPWFEDFKHIIQTYSMAELDAVLAGAVEEVIAGRPNGDRTHYQAGIMEGVFEVFDETLEADLRFASNPYLSDKARTEFNDRVMVLSDSLLSYYERYRPFLPVEVYDAVFAGWLVYDTLYIEIDGSEPCQALRQYRIGVSSSRPKTSPWSSFSPSR